MDIQFSQNEKTVSWLLEPVSPGVRYLSLRDLLKYPPEHPDLDAARKTAHSEGPIAEILDQMNEEGYWSEPGPGYLPKYWSTVWSIITLAQLGALIREDQRIAQACAYVLAHSLTPNGQFTATGSPSGTADCIQGNLCWALAALGCDDPRLDVAFEWMARTVTGEGIASADDRQAVLRYYAGKCGPRFACGSNNKLPCAWGAAKVMLAFGQWPEPRRTPLIRRAIEQGAAFLLEGDPARAEYPNGWADKPSQNWWKFGFPVFYVTDMLQILEALTASGYGNDPRLDDAVKIVRNKQDANGHWPLEYDYAGKTWVSFGEKKQPSKWVTLRALRVLQAVR